jgi:2-keto-4-pentenoate hydratase/2-oxohepta-3-ene-1,7-dioic acid hydratase in catechol pathway
VSATVASRRWLLVDGDVVTVEIEGVGRIEDLIVSDRPPAEPSN